MADTPAVDDMAADTLAADIQGGSLGCSGTFKRLQSYIILLILLIKFSYLL